MEKRSCECRTHHRTIRTRPSGVASLAAIHQLCKPRCLYCITHQDEVTELLHLERSLEGQLQFRSLNDDIREIEQVHLERIEHTLSSDDDLLGLFFDGERTDESSDLLGSLPFGELTETFLTGPHGSVNDFEEELTGSGVKLSRQQCTESGKNA